MLPKVATHILHSTSRAAASIHSQTHTLRNVLQIQSSGPSGSGSGRGSNGPGPGGAKHHTGSRFHSSYNGAGRAVTQANATTSNDGEFIQDDNEEPVPRRAPVPAPRTRTRIRSSSLSLPVNGRRERGEKLGVLRTVQMHTQSRHVFAPQFTGDEDSTRMVDAHDQLDSSSIVDSEDLSDLDSLSRPPLVRRNSTCSSLPPSRPTSPALSRRNSTVSHHSVEGKAYVDMPPPSPRSSTVTPATASPAPASASDKSPLTLRRTEIMEALKAARDNADPDAAAEAMRMFKAEISRPYVNDYNVALSALAATRTVGELLTPLLQLYDEMVERAIFPNTLTYLILLRQLTRRDAEIHRLQAVIESRLKRQELINKYETDDMKLDRKRLEDLNQENNFAAAMTLFESLLVANSNEKIPSDTYNWLLRGAAYRSNKDTALHVFSHFDSRKDISPGPLAFRHLMQMYINCNDLGGVETVFNEYIERCEGGRMVFEEGDTYKEVASARREHLRVWNQVVKAYFHFNMSDKAIGIVERMMKSAAGPEYGLKDTPIPASSTFTAVISGFCQLGDMESALRWFDMLLKQGHVVQNPWLGVMSEPVKPDAVAWANMLDTLAMKGMIDDLNRLFSVLLDKDTRYNIRLRPEDGDLVVAANLQLVADADHEKALGHLQFAEKVATNEDMPDVFRVRALTDIIEAYVAKDLQSEMRGPLEALKTIASNAVTRSADPITESVVRKAQVTIAKLALLTNMPEESIVQTQPEPLTAQTNIPEEIYVLPRSKAQPKTPRIDAAQTKLIETALNRRGPSAPNFIRLYDMFMNGISRGKAPAHDIMGRLIQVLGRNGDVAKVHGVYAVTQNLLTRLPIEAQSQAWHYVEDSMVIALAHAGQVDAAHVHRLRILEQGGAPTADAYGALILHVKDTTDDTSNAMALFNESQTRGVVPNLYLYNNIISKLAKARKADYALELFQRMKLSDIQPSSITYGAVIGACARVGDAVSAENLFAEMTQAPKFKPRVPPYNTMMQLYTTTKPNRERALHYYEEMKKAEVAPSAHTYKLLLDVYGSIEPVDINSMENIFQEVQRRNRIALQGYHFASLLNAYGCVLKDLQKAVDVFDSISSYKVPEALDAVVFETMFNVLVAHRRVDLIPQYLTKMSQANIHMTAYIANTLIKGYSNVGEMDEARGIFERLCDPPVGVAAPNNHAPHDPESSPTVSPAEPVYREPSTWEAMIRAELGAGNRNEAHALLERLSERRYPEAVFNRISGIFVDHSTLPAP